MMATFYGSVQGTCGEVHRLGSKKSGLVTVAASWEGAVEVMLTHGKDGVHATVRLKPWHGRGGTECLYHGPVGGREIAEAVPKMGDVEK